MRRLLFGLFAVMCTGGAPLSAAQSKVCICHFPPGNPDNAHTICVGAPAVRAHLRHGDTMGECPVTCGGPNEIPCDAGEFCRRDVGVCDPLSEGVCAPLPTDCETDLEPVCGCDGVTYDNACLADAAGVAVEHVGACDGIGEACGGEAGDSCDVGQFCKREDGSCDPASEGICMALPALCPPTNEPVCGCDGTTYSNSCFADAAGVPVSSTGACVEGVACGGAAGDTCAGTEFCRRDTGTCAEDAEGNCAPIPLICSGLFAPVCGCDEVTYDNACQAAVAGVSISHSGRCDADVVACSGATCAAGSFCHRADGDCAADAPGTCEPSPTSCPAVVAPVCGCDGITYTNACIADALGVAVASEGACEPDRACGGTTGVTCGTGAFCQSAVGVCTEGADGVCTAMPTSCSVTSNPVCGCDGNTYDNACLAAAAGVTINTSGACPPPG